MPEASDHSTATRFLPRLRGSNYFDKIIYVKTCLLRVGIVRHVCVAMTVFATGSLL